MQLDPVKVFQERVLLDLVHPVPVAKHVFFFIEGRRAQLPDKVEYFSVFSLSSELF